MNAKTTLRACLKYGNYGTIWEPLCNDPDFEFERRVNPRVGLWFWAQVSVVLGFGLLGLSGFGP